MYYDIMQRLQSLRTFKGGSPGAPPAPPKPPAASDALNASARRMAELRKRRGFESTILSGPSPGPENFVQRKTLLGG